MKKTHMILAGAVAAALIGGTAFLVTTDVPVKQTMVEKTLSNDRFFTPGTN